MYRHETATAVAETIQSVPSHSYISRGRGRSYGDAAVNDGDGVLCHERMNRFLAWDPAAALLECEAGVTFEEIIATFLPRGYFPPVTPGTKHVTMGGAVAADVHGKNHHRDGSFEHFVDGFDLLTASGSVRRCSRQENVELFRATLGGMGLTGVILRVRLRLLPVASAWMRVANHRTANLDESLDCLGNADRSHRYSVAWIDGMAHGAAMGRGIVTAGDHLDASDLPPGRRANPFACASRRPRPAPRWWPAAILNRHGIRVFNALRYRSHPIGESLVDYDSFFYPLDRLTNWNRLYGAKGFLQYQCVLPATVSRSGMMHLLETLHAAGQAPFLCVLKSFGAEGAGLLSFPMPGFTLALDLPNRGAATRAITSELDRLVIRQGGRIYLAKDATLAAEHLEAMYPRLGEFRAIRDRYDPAHRFQSSLSRRLGLETATQRMEAA
jgi:decaprenylphospho-beta-D-ribofuranose 2-oxidase